jgi:hypothetical protein
MNTKIRSTFLARHILDCDHSAFLEVFDLVKMPDVALTDYAGALQIEVQTA